jgi:hypothetical protein
MDNLDILTLAEAGDLLGRSPSTMRSQVAAGRLRARLIGKTWITTRDEIERYRRSNLGRPGRPEIADLAVEIPWPSNMYRVARALQIRAFHDTPQGDVDAVVDAAQGAIDRGAWTMAEVLTPVMTGPKTQGIPFHYADDPPTITLVRGTRVDRSLVLGEEERSEVRQDVAKIDSRGDGH